MQTLSAMPMLQTVIERPLPASEIISADEAVAFAALDAGISYASAYWSRCLLRSRPLRTGPCGRLSQERDFSC